MSAAEDNVEESWKCFRRSLRHRPVNEAWRWLEVQYIAWVLIDTRQTDKDWCKIPQGILGTVVPEGRRRDMCEGGLAPSPVAIPREGVLAQAGTFTKVSLVLALCQN